MSVGARLSTWLLAAAALAALPARAGAQTLQPGDKLVYETAAAFGFERLPRRISDPCTLETRLAIGVGKVDAAGMDVDVEVALGVRAVRYSGPGFSWSLEPATLDGFIGVPLTSREADDLASAPLPCDVPPLARELVRRELSLISTVATIHGCHASARIACGPDPFVRIDELTGAPLSDEQRAQAMRYLRAVLLLALPPVPPDLAATGARDERGRYEAGGSSYEVLGFRDAYWPIRGREHRVRALEPSSAARAAFAFEVIHDTGLEPAPGGPVVREWADVHATLGIAGRRQVRVASPLAKPGDPSQVVAAVATWTTDLVRATRVVRRQRSEPTEEPLDAPKAAP